MTLFNSSRKNIYCNVFSGKTGTPESRLIKGNKSSQDPPPGKATYTITSLYHHLWIAPLHYCPTAPVTTALYTCPSASKPPTSDASCNITRLVTSHPLCHAAIMPFWACTFPPHPQDPQSPLGVSLHWPHFSPQTQSPADIGDGKEYPYTIDIHRHGIPPEHKRCAGDAKPKPEMSTMIVLANGLILQVGKLC